MDYCNFNNTDLNDTNFNNTDFRHSIPSVYGGLYRYPFLGQAPGVEGAITQAHQIPADPWSSIPWQDPVAGQPANLLAATGHEPVAETASFAGELNGYGQPSYANNFTPIGDRQPDFLSQDALFVGSTMVPDASTIIPGPNSVKSNSWGENVNEPSTSMFGWGMHDTHQSGSGPMRTGHISAERFQPYSTSSSNSSDHWSTEAGPPTLVPQQAPHVAPSTLRPTGGIIPETAADAENTQTTTDEDEVPPPKRARFPKGQGRHRGGRKQAQGDARELCTRVQRWKKLSVLPSQNKALAYVLEIVPVIRSVVYQHPQLTKGEWNPSQEGSKSAMREKRRRNIDRGHFRELSRYYQLPLGKRAWGRPVLLRKLMKDLDDNPHLIEPSDAPAPSTSGAL